MNKIYNLTYQHQEKYSRHQKIDENLKNSLNSIKFIRLSIFALYFDIDTDHIIYHVCQFHLSEHLQRQSPTKLIKIFTTVEHLELLENSLKFFDIKVMKLEPRALVHKLIIDILYIIRVPHSKMSHIPKPFVNFSYSS